MRVMSTVDDFYNLTDSQDSVVNHYEDDEAFGMGFPHTVAEAVAEREIAYKAVQSTTDQESDHHTEVNMKSVQCYDDHYVKNSKVDCKAYKEIDNHRVCVSTSPSFQLTIASSHESIRETLTLDTSCTAKSIVNKAFTDSLGLPITPTNIRSATLGYR